MTDYNLNHKKPLQKQHQIVRLKTVILYKKVKRDKQKLIK